MAIRELVPDHRKVFFVRHGELVACGYDPQPLLENEKGKGGREGRPSEVKVGRRDR